MRADPPRDAMHDAHSDDLRAVLDDLGATTPMAVALYDYQTGHGLSCRGDCWFHAASTIKIAVLAAVYAVLESRDLTPFHRLHVRNRFFSAFDGSPYRILAARDADADVHASIGRTMRIGDLARHMIAVSSNLATNVLLDYVGVEPARAMLRKAGIAGVDLVRGVEDDRAFDAGISNRVTADGLLALLRAILEGRFASADLTAEMIDILSAQAFNSGIPLGLPPAVRSAARVAHKTGEISTVTHDAGLIFLPGRPPYGLVVLTGTPANAPDRFAPIARISAAAFERIASAGARLERGAS